MSSSPSQSTEAHIENSTAVADAEPVALETAARPSTSPKTGETATPSLYRIIWRWHFYAGLIVAPILFVAAATGALYVFKVEASNWLYADLYFVEPRGQRLSYDQQWSVARGIAQGRELEALMISPDPRRSTRFIVHIDGDGDVNPAHKHHLYYVDPYNGEVLGSQIQEQEFFWRVMDLHRTLFAGTTGRVIVELATSWGLVLMLTGAYLWWPRTKGRIRGIWRPRLRGKPYAVLRDWHAVCGIYVLPFAVVILATGLFFSAVFGGGYTWLSVQSGQSLGGILLAPMDSKPVTAETPPASLESVVTRVLEHSRPDDSVYIQAPQRAEHAYKAFLMRQEDVNTILTVHVDRYTGETLSVIRTDELPPMLRGLALVSSLHQGKTFGLSSKIIAFLSCLVLMGMAVTGVWMWWKRRPRGETGFPQRSRPGTAPKGLWAIVILIGIVLPTVGASMVVIALGSRLIAGSLSAAPT